MIFCHKNKYGKDFFYPIDEKAESFVNAFPTSGGKRKCLTVEQITLLQTIDTSLQVQSKDFIQDLRVGHLFKKP